MTSSSPPRAPRSASAGSSRPPSSRSTASAPGCGQQPVGALADGDDDGVAGQLLERVVGGGDRRRHRSILGVPDTVPPVSPLTSPLHDRHVAAGAKLADFGGWSMPIEYAGGGVLAEHTAVREARRASSTSPTWARRRCAAPAPRRSSTPA